jgi:hypothetical protein
LFNFCSLVSDSKQTENKQRCVGRKIAETNYWDVSTHAAVERWQQVVRANAISNLQIALGTPWFTAHKLPPPPPPRLEHLPPEQESETRLLLVPVISGEFVPFRREHAAR